ncbi:MAG: extracellular solute-binding protein, partial [Clostridia bacterium]|nr:extracellular solute-binding protein [Clostridia bacterium]
NSQNSANGFTFIQDLIANGYTSYSIAPTAFFNEQVGMYLSSGWTIPDLDNKYKEHFASRDDWGLLPYPKSVTAASATGSWSCGITNNHHADKTAIKELLLWLTTAESSDAITLATGMIPARKSVNRNYAQGSPEYTLMKQLELSGRERPVTVAYPKFSTCFNQVIAQLGNRDVIGKVMDLLNAQAGNLQNEMNRLNK